MKDGMKVVGLSGYFLLPENFNGDVSAALRALADYHDKARKGETPGPRKNEKGGDMPNAMWGEFCETVNNGQSLHMAVSLVKWNGAKGDWEYTDSFKEEIKEVGGSG